jgi:lipoyl(octanoyl) transferase
VTSSALEWKLSVGLVEYPTALAAMEERVDQLIAGSAPEMLWFLEHPPLYTGGTSTRPADLLSHEFPFYDAGRGGQITYHGPGQRVAYVMLNLKERSAMDVRAFVGSLEQWLIRTLAHFGIEGFTREGRVGVWVHDPAQGEAKIAALGIRMRRWVTFHGIALNVQPNLDHYRGIVPCGIRGYGITSMHNMGVKASMSEVDAALKAEFEKLFRK